MNESIYKRVLLKLSGESLAEQDGGFGIDVGAIKNLAQEVRTEVQEQKNAVAA